MKKYFSVVGVAAIASLLIMSCRTSKTVSSHDHTEVFKKDSAYQRIDTGKTVLTVTDAVRINYGDTVIGSLAFTDQQIRDMESNDSAFEVFESNGIKIQMSLKPFAGGMKARVKAIAKPVGSETVHTESRTDQKGETITAKKTETTVLSDSTKDVKIVGFPWRYVAFVVALIAVIAIVIFFIKNNKNESQQSKSVKRN